MRWCPHVVNNLNGFCCLSISENAFTSPLSTQQLTLFTSHNCRNVVCVSVCVFVWLTVRVLSLLSVCNPIAHHLSANPTERGAWARVSVSGRYSRLVTGSVVLFSCLGCPKSNTVVSCFGWWCVPLCRVVHRVVCWVCPSTTYIVLHGIAPFTSGVVPLHPLA